MKIREGFAYNEVCGEAMVVPMGESNIDFSKIIGLNPSSALLWKRMEQGEFTKDDLVKLLLDEYEVDEATASRDVDALLAQLRAENMIE